MTESRYINKLKPISSCYVGLKIVLKKLTFQECLRLLATLVLYGAEIGNYAVTIIMTLDIRNTAISVKKCVNLS